MPKYINVLIQILWSTDIHYHDTQRLIHHDACPIHIPRNNCDNLSSMKFIIIAKPSALCNKDHSKKHSAIVTQFHKSSQCVLCSHLF